VTAVSSARAGDKAVLGGELLTGAADDLLNEGSRSVSTPLPGGTVGVTDCPSRSWSAIRSEIEYGARSRGRGRTASPAFRRWCCLDPLSAPPRTSRRGRAGTQCRGDPRASWRYEEAQAALVVSRRTRDELVRCACRHHDVREVAGATGLSDSYARKLFRQGRDH
jgi:hypothetical protein